MGGSVCNVYAHQEKYSRAVERLAQEEDTALVDLRGAFLDHGHLDQIIGPDGTHPSSAGQALIRRTFAEFARKSLTPQGA
jgi:lysophospholipase L1-like esterase